MKWILLGVLITIGLAVYGLAGHALGAFNAREVARLLTRRAQ